MTDDRKREENDCKSHAHNQNYVTKTLADFNESAKYNVHLIHIYEADNRPVG